MRKPVIVVYSISLSKFAFDTLSDLRRVQALSFMPPFEFKLQRALAVAPLTLSYLAMITLSNLCLKYVEASFYQVCSFTR
jgi:hypothetical protein